MNGLWFVVIVALALFQIPAYAYDTKKKLAAATASQDTDRNHNV